MRPIIGRSTVITFVLVLLFSSTAMSAQERRTALVIGNGAYKSSPLANPVNDATDMASALKKLGFSVKLKINANQKSMENAIRAFGKELRSGGVGLFYFAGHGIQVHGFNYLIPIGADIESESDVKYEAVNAGLILGKMEDAGNGLNIIILDACRDNPFARSFRSSEKEEYPGISGTFYNSCVKYFFNRVISKSYDCCKNMGVLLLCSCHFFSAMFSPFGELTA